MSYGKDGAADALVGGETTNFNDDIIFVERPVRPVPRGRAAVSPPVVALKSPLTGALSFFGLFRAPRIPAVKRGLTTGRTALLGGALGLAFAAALLGPGALLGLVPARGDLADFFWPMKAYTAARWAAGGLPLWNPLSGCGEPWLAQLQTGVLYPGDLPFLLGGAAGPLARARAPPRDRGGGHGGVALRPRHVARGRRSPGAAVWAGGGAFLVARARLQQLLHGGVPPVALPRGAPRRARRLAGALRSRRRARVPRRRARACGGGAAARRGSSPSRRAARSDAPRASAGARRRCAPAGGPPSGVGLAAAALGPFVVLVTSTGRIAGATRAEALARPVGRADLADLAVAARGRRDAPRRRRGGAATSRRSRSGRSRSSSPRPRAPASPRGRGSSSRSSLLAALSAPARARRRAAGSCRSSGTAASRAACASRRAGSSSAHLALAAAAGAGLDGWRDGHLLAWPRRATHEAEPPAKTPLVLSAAVALGALGVLAACALAERRVPGVAAWASFAGRGRRDASFSDSADPADVPRADGGGAPRPLRRASSPARDARRLRGRRGGRPRAAAARRRGPPVRRAGPRLSRRLGRRAPEGMARRRVDAEDTPRRAHEALAGYGTLPLGLASAASPSPIANPWRTRLLGAALSGGDAGALLGLADVRRVVTPFPTALPGARLERRAGDVLRYALERPLGRVFFARDAAVLDDDAVFRSLSARTFEPEARALLAPGGGALPPPRPSRGYAVAKVTHDAARDSRDRDGDVRRRRPRRHARVGLGLGSAAGRRPRRAAPLRSRAHGRRRPGGRAPPPARLPAARVARRARPSPGARSSSSSASSSRAGRRMARDAPRRGSRRALRRRGRHRGLVRERLHPPAPARRVRRPPALALPGVRDAGQRGTTTSPSSRGFSSGGAAAPAARRSRRATRSSRRRARSLFAGAALLWGPTAVAAGGALLALAGVILVATDLETRTLPDEVTLGTLALGLVVAAVRDRAAPAGESFLSGHAHLVEAVLGATAGAAFLELVRRAYAAVRGGEGMGGGDVKMLAMAGAFTGPAGVFLTLFFASLAGTAVAGSAALLRRARWTLAFAAAQRDAERAGAVRALRRPPRGRRRAARRRGTTLARDSGRRGRGGTPVRRPAHGGPPPRVPPARARPRPRRRRVRVGAHPGRRRRATSSACSRAAPLRPRRVSSSFSRAWTSRSASSSPWAPSSRSRSAGRRSRCSSERSRPCPRGSSRDEPLVRARGAERHRGRPRDAPVSRGHRRRRPEKHDRVGRRGKRATPRARDARGRRRARGGREPHPRARGRR